MHLAGTGTFRPLSPVVFIQVARGLAECEMLEARHPQRPAGTRARVPVPPARDGGPSRVGRRSRRGLRRLGRLRGSVPDPVLPAVRTDPQRRLEHLRRVRASAHEPIWRRQGVRLRALEAGSPRSRLARSRRSRPGNGSRTNNGSHYAAAITYFSFLALFPLLLLAAAVLGFVLRSNEEPEEPADRRHHPQHPGFARNAVVEQREDRGRIKHEHRPDRPVRRPAHRTRLGRQPAGGDQQRLGRQAEEAELRDRQGGEPASCWPVWVSASCCRSA